MLGGEIALRNTPLRTCESMTDIGESVRARIPGEWSCPGSGVPSLHLPHGGSRGLTGGWKILIAARSTVDVEGGRVP